MTYEYHTDIPRPEWTEDELAKAYEILQRMVYALRNGHYSIGGHIQCRKAKATCVCKRHTNIRKQAERYGFTTIQYPTG